MLEVERDDRGFGGRRGQDNEVMKDVRRDCLTLGHRLQLRMLAYMLGSG
jgi:hypothetical protein